jgi:ferredoxin
MKGAILYYSSTGNTRLACGYIAAHLRMPVDLVDVVRQRDVDLAPYDVVGLATWTDFGGPPRLFLDVMEGLPPQQGKPAFVFNTYGAISIKTLRILARTATRKGFAVIAAHSLQTPESYPPMIAGGRGAEDAPDERQMVALDAFIAELDQRLTREGELLVGRRVRIGLLNSLIPAFRRTHARADMGPKSVDESLCIECGLCAKGCPYGAIRLQPKPVFDQERCHGCWRCYHRCPEHAICTARFRGGPYYPHPNERLRAKLEV